MASLANGGDIFVGGVTIRYKTDMTSYVIMHETLHALGLGHGNAWCGIMSYSCPTNEPTAEDVAYFILFQTTYATEKTWGDHDALLESRQP